MKRKTTIFLLLLPFLLITGIVLISVWPNTPPPHPTPADATPRRVGGPLR